MEFGALRDWLPQLPSDGISATTLAIEGPHGLDIELGQAARGQALNSVNARRLLIQYPALRDFELWLGHDGELVLGQDTTRVKVRVPSTADLKFNRSGHSLLPAGTTRYRGQEFIFPAVGSGAKALHPLTSWWLVLYALSMVARYSPPLWMSSLAIGSSPISSQLEFVMDAALSAVPELLAEALLALNEAPQPHEAGPPA